MTKKLTPRVGDRVIFKVDGETQVGVIDQSVTITSAYGSDIRTGSVTVKWMDWQGHRAEQSAGSMRSKLLTVSRSSGRKGGNQPVPSTLGVSGSPQRSPDSTKKGWTTGLRVPNTYGLISTS